MFFRKTVILVLLAVLSSITFAYEKVPVIIPFKAGGELHTFFYCFNEMSEGKKVAEEIFRIKKFDELVKGEKEKVLPVPVGTNVGYYDHAIFCYGEEFWLFDNRNGFLWGRGMLLSEPRN